MVVRVKWKSASAIGGCGRWLPIPHVEGAGKNSRTLADLFIT